MKPLLILLFIVALASCATIDPIPVYRSKLTMNRIESHMRYPFTVYYAIWKDSRGVEYSEIVRDTAAFRKGGLYSQLLKK